MSSKRLILHLLPNAHIDPVWLWDWREGLNEGLVTVRTILDLMDEAPHLTFIRGESAIYEHIEKTDPGTFERIGRMVESGRWDVVGGTHVQPDSNLPATETLCRQFERGLRYFESRFGKRPTIAWQADSFGHTPGWPNILRAFGMEGFTFTRPQRSEFPMQSPVFWWETDYGDRTLCYRQHWKWYCSERFNLIKTLDLTLAEARLQPFVNVSLLMGLGNHGGGPTRRHLQEVENWAKAHPEVEVRFSTLHGFFKALQEELSAIPNAAPTVRGDLGFALRGCYSSVAKLKNPYRKAEALLVDSETTQAIIAASTGNKTMPLDDAWDSILFNAFHDILPGSSIERAFDDQIAWVGLASHRAHEARFRALNQLAGRVDTRVPAATKPDRATDVPLLVWNPLPRPVTRWFELEASLDYRPIRAYSADVGSMPLSLEAPNSEKLRFQEIATEHHSMREMAWRKRVVVYDEIPAFGWKVYRFGYREEGEPRTEKPAGSVAAPASSIEMGDWRVALNQDNEIQIQRNAQDFFSDAGAMQIRLVEDPWGSWGGMEEEVESYCLETLRETWKVTRAEITEHGPYRSALWTRWQGNHSWLELTFYVSADTPGVRVTGRLLMNERSARLKLVLPCCGPLVMDVPGSRAERNMAGQLPAGRWISRGKLGFVSDVLGDIDATPDELRITLARASRYADDVRVAPDEKPWLATADTGELKFEFWIVPSEADLPSVAEDLLHPPVSMLVPPHPGHWGPTGSLGGISPSCVKLLAAPPTSDGKLKLRVQNCSDSEVEALFQTNLANYSLGRLRPWEIITREIYSETDKLTP